MGHVHCIAEITFCNMKLHQCCIAAIFLNIGNHLPHYENNS
jgi:hypothetical protein